MGETTARNVFKELMNSAIKKFEVFETFFNNEKGNLDYKTRLAPDEVEDTAVCHTLDEYMRKKWGYDSPLAYMLEKKKALKVSENGLGRKEMETILRDHIVEDENKEKGKWDKLMGVAN